MNEKKASKQDLLLNSSSLNVLKPNLSKPKTEPNQTIDPKEPWKRSRNVGISLRKRGMREREKKRENANYMLIRYFLRFSFTKFPPYYIYFRVFAKTTQQQQQQHTAPFISAFFFQIRIIIYSLSIYFLFYFLTLIKWVKNNLKNYVVVFQHFLVIIKIIII